MMIIKRLTINRRINKDATIKVLKTFKENKYSRSTLLKKKITCMQKR